MNDLKTAISEIARQNPNGFTVEIETLKPIKKGISAAYLETQDCFGDEGLERVLKHAEDHDKKVGGWLNEDDGNYYFDSVRIFTNLEEAVRFGRENQQIAIFDIGRKKLIKL